MNKEEQIQIPNTLTYWHEWEHVDDPKCLKAIRGGNLNGKTDINPVWRMKKLTEVFGPVGFGWNVTEKERWTNECAGEVGAFVKVELRINIGGTWSEPIEGIGGSKLCGTGHGDGLNDEAWKMATTDAISVACKSLGMAAEVYTGKQTHDNNTAGPDYGTKYEPRQQQTTRQPAATAKPKKLSEAGYWQMVRKYGDGIATQAGGDYRTEWIENYNPTPDQIAKFDADVRDYQAAKAGDGKLQ